MSQTSIIIGGLAVAYLVYITAKGQLPGYLYVLGLSSSMPQGCTAPTTATTTTTTTGTGQTVTTQGGTSLGGILTTSPLGQDFISGEDYVSAPADSALPSDVPNLLGSGTL